MHLIANPAHVATSGCAALWYSAATTQRIGATGPRLHALAGRYTRRAAASFNCPEHFNPDQRNSDGDSRGDRCDNCPFADNEEQRDVDVEIPDPSGGDFPTRIGDGVGDACDVCPDRLDPLQLDCNHDATREVRAREAARGVPVAERTPFRGDACDPTPCGETRLAARAPELGGAATLREVVTDRLLIDGLASPGLFAPAQTAFRFCPCEAADRDTPERRSDCAVLRLCTIADTPNYLRSEATGVPEAPWSFVRFELTDETPAPPPRGPGGFPPVVDNPILDARYAPPGETFVSDRFVRWLEAARGVLWTHTPRFTSGTAFADPATQDLASHYLSGGFSAPWIVREPDPCIVLAAPFLGGGLDCPFCGVQFPSPWIAFPGLDAACSRARLDVPILFLGLRGVTPVPGVSLDGLGHFANEPSGWVSAAESTPWLPEEGVRYARLDEASQLVRVLSVVGDRLVDPDASPCPPPQCPGLIAPASSTASPSPGPRPGAVHVLSARLNQVWVLGGRDARGEALGDVWALDLASRHWRRLPLGPAAQLGEVLAATYSPTDDALYVLDRVAPRDRSHPLFPGRWARLVRLHPDGVMHTVEAYWPAVGSNDRYVLATEPSGAVWVVASPSRGARAHAVVRLTRAPGEGVRIVGWSVGPGRLLAGGARAGDQGLTVALDRGTVELVGIEPSSLRRAPGGERACF